MPATSWKQALAETMPEDLAHEIDVYEGQIELKRQGKINDKVFAETRLRRGAYGQRYDNGRRHDGLTERTLPFPSDGLTKGPGGQPIDPPPGPVAALPLNRQFVNSGLVCPL